MRQKGFSQIFPIILFLVLVGGGTYYITSSPAQTVPTTIPTTDPTASWKTYSTDKYGISFKYPLDWDFAETKDTDDRSGYCINIFQLTSPNTVISDYGAINGGYLLTFNVSALDKNYSNIHEFLNYTKDQYGYSLTAERINNIDGYSFNVTDKQTGYIFGKGDYFFMINLRTDKDIQTLNQVLSTFRFID